MVASSLSILLNVITIQSFPDAWNVWLKECPNASNNLRPNCEKSGSIWFKSKLTASNSHGYGIYLFITYDVIHRGLVFQPWVGWKHVWHDRWLISAQWANSIAHVSRPSHPHTLTACRLAPHHFTACWGGVGFARQKQHFVRDWSMVAQVPAYTWSTCWPT